MKRLGKHFVLVVYPAGTRRIGEQSFTTPSMEIINELSIYQTKKGFFVHTSEGQRHYGVLPMDPPQTINGFFVEYVVRF
jgi:hypothetical protein